MGDNDRERHLYTDGFAIERKIGPWSVLMEWPLEAEQGPYRVDIRPAEGVTPEQVAGGVSSTVLRQIDFTSGRSEFRELVAQMRALNPQPVHTWSGTELRELASEGISDMYLAALADTYVALVRAGEPSVTVKLGEMLGKSPETIRQHLKRVRKAGFLTTIPGKAGGQLTDKARAFLPPE